MRPYGIGLVLNNLIGPYAFLWVLLGPYKFLCLLRGLYGSL